MPVQLVVPSKKAVLKAIQFTYPVTEEFRKFVNGYTGEPFNNGSPDAKWSVLLNDDTVVEEGDWIILGVTGYLFAKTDKEFKEQYMPYEPEA